MKTIADPPKRDRWARLRFLVIGPLLAAPPEPGQLNGAFNALAAKTWRHPVTGLDVRFGASTLERWYYRARRAADPVAALKDRLRGDEGCFPSLSPVAVAALTSTCCSRIVPLADPIVPASMSIKPRVTAQVAKTACHHRPV